MLFNSYIFIFLFLPFTLIVYYRIGSKGNYNAAISWLVLASLFFYAWWNASYLYLLVGSIVLNYGLGILLSNHNDTHKSKLLLIIGVVINITILGYCKYANFFVVNANIVFDTNYHLDTIILPLAISFFTFQQITYLVDAYRGLTEEHNFLHYCLFVTFFPQLIAGPIVHHKEMLSQFSKKSTYSFSHDKIAIGLSIFIIGLFKKVVIADNIALYSTPVFAAAQDGVVLSFLEAWGGALSYTFQLYFDFSGYSDMAVGLAYLFGIRLALNFFSPYKAVNIIEFWRFWHITLSRFLRDYLYIPLGGNRKGAARRYINLMITMLLGGLWHGAGWSFVIWGGLHGFYLIVNLLWRKLWFFLRGEANHSNVFVIFLSRSITLTFVVVAWVFFRAESLPAAQSIIEGMAGFNGIILPQNYQNLFNHLFSFGDVLNSAGIRFEKDIPYFSGIGHVMILVLLLLIVWFTPNTYQIFSRYSPIIDSTNIESSNNSIIKLYWRPNIFLALLMLVLFFITFFHMDLTSEFLYFQF